MGGKDSAHMRKTQYMPDTLPAAVVLGAAIRPDGSPSPAMLRRLAHGAALWRAGRVGHLILSGGLVRHPPAEARVMQALALAAGVGEDCLILEERSRNTAENARFCAPLCQERGWRQLLLVTDGWHMRRALYCFRRVGLSPVAAPAPAEGQGWLPLLREACALPLTMVKLERGLRRG